MEFREKWFFFSKEKREMAWSVKNNIRKKRKNTKECEWKMELQSTENSDEFNFTKKKKQIFFFCEIKIN